MPSLDDELRAAAEAAPTSAQLPIGAPRKPKRNLGLLIGLLVMGGGILALALTSFENAAIYSKGVDELMKDPQKYAARTLRVEGNLVHGSLMRRDEPCEYRFRIKKQEAELAVHYAQCSVPDTFRDVPGMDVQVTAEGRLADSGNFEATKILAKCPSKYEMRDRAGKGEKAPHGDMNSLGPQSAL